VIKVLSYDGDTVSLQEHLDRWLETSAKGPVKPITYEAYERTCRLHIKPSMGKVKLSKLTPRQVQGFYQDKLNSGLAPSSVRYMHATLHRVLKQAHRWRLVRENVAAATDPPAVGYTPGSYRSYSDTPRLHGLWIGTVTGYRAWATRQQRLWRLH
jgi:Phage integrase, N-terminal SAM-like domain